MSAAPIELPRWADVALVPLVSVAAALLVASAPNRAADPKPDAKWPTQRTTQPEDVEDLRALEARV